MSPERASRIACCSEAGPWSFELMTVMVFPKTVSPAGRTTAAAARERWMACISISSYPVFRNPAAIVTGVEYNNRTVDEPGLARQSVSDHALATGVFRRAPRRGCEASASGLLTIHSERLISFPYLAYGALAVSSPTSGWRYRVIIPLPGCISSASPASPRPVCAAVPKGRGSVAPRETPPFA